ncbi:PREDICTED: melatonin receptor type 1A-like [Acropora digitifera]|uniref:melatonin receptor type 1A-like n=1 Tax=Acropora digitifera TaxID=70779 RepID=UPI00077A1482|nr:PREDICTED: melatonin receptor type 1A-like [Acropora digitifera]XP_015776174.1 PREDICTED: melatonin receptor type 1A-like [Acropora digitifera]
MASNGTSHENPYKELMLILKSRSTAEYVSETFLYMLINLMALLGNLMVCLIFYKNPRFRCVTYLYIFALAVSDVAMATLCMPLVWGVLLIGEWRYSTMVCAMHGFAVLFLAFVSLQTIALLAFNRYCRVIRPWLFRRIFTKQFVVFSLILVAISAAVLLGLPLIAGWGFFHFHSGKITCVLEFHNQTTDKIYTGFLGLVIVVLPFSVIIFCYSKVFLLVQKHRRRFLFRDCTNRNISAPRLSIEEIRITRTLFAIVLGFSLCWVPVFVIEFTDSVTGNHSLPRRVYLLNVFLVSISGAINPIIYGILNRTFRMEYYRMWPVCCTFASNLRDVPRE